MEIFFLWDSQGVKIEEAQWQSLDIYISPRESFTTYGLGLVNSLAYHVLKQVRRAF